jgi:hypothetical protein
MPVLDCGWNIRAESTQMHLLRIGTGNYARSKRPDDTDENIAFLPVLLFGLTGCQDALDSVSNKVEHPLPAKLVNKMKANDMSTRSPIMMRIFKEEGILEVWKQKGQWPLRHHCFLRDLQMVGQARTQVQGRRSPGARGVLPDLSVRR